MCLEEYPKLADKRINVVSAYSGTYCPPRSCYASQVQKRPLSRIFQIWWPLALSWLFMGLEQPLISAVIARLADPTIHLAALGIVFPLALMIESPIIMLLSASTALADHKQAYRLMYRFMMISGAVITVIHALLAFTPLYDLVIVQAFKPPEEIIEPARWGLMALLPWTWSIAHRRYQQGVLIRYGDSKAISVGTLFRLIANLVAMLTAALVGLPGIVVAGLGISAGVLTEAIYIASRARPIVRTKLPEDETNLLRWGKFMNFYVPLAFTSILLLGSQPLGSAALSRMPNALNSLAVWPVLVSFIFLFRGLGFAINEVVVTALKEKIADFADLNRFAVLISIGLSATLTLIAFTPLARVYFDLIAGLPSDLAQLAVAALAFAIFWPAISVYRNLFQGVIVFNGQTRFVTESVVASLVVTSVLLFIGVSVGTYTGIFVGIISFLVGNIVQVLWLVWRSQAARQQLTRLEPTLSK